MKETKKENLSAATVIDNKTRLCRRELFFQPLCPKGVLNRGSFRITLCTVDPFRLSISDMIVFEAVHVGMSPMRQKGCQ